YSLNWPPAFSQGTPTDQRARQREKGLVDDGAFIVADSETAELIQPCERPIDDPPRPAQAAAVCRAAHRQQWHNATSSQPLSDARRIVVAVANHAIRPIPWPSTFTLEWRNRID